MRNGVVLAAGLVAAAVVGEAYLRFTKPFMLSSIPKVMVPGVGRMKQLNTEVRHTNRRDFWTTARTNRYGFLDREPPDLDRAAKGCHVAFIGDSFVDAMEVPIEQKVQVRLEELAADEMPELDLVATAFGRQGTGQIEQLAYYDKYTRRMHPKLLVVVWVPNDLRDNSPVLRGADGRWDPDRFPGNTGTRRIPDGEIELRPPHPKPRRLATVPRPWLARIMDGPSRASYLAGWLDQVLEGIAHQYSTDHELANLMEVLTRRPRYRAALDGWRPTTRSRFQGIVGQENLPPVFAEGLEYAVFALEQFKERADRDGAELVVLAVHVSKLGFWSSRVFDRMAAVADAVDVPLIDHADYILGLGHELGDAHWAHDLHWNAAGHLWAAQAVLEHIRDNPEICADRRQPAS